jgi:hypothetical protein
MQSVSGLIGRRTALSGYDLFNSREGKRDAFALPSFGWLPTGSGNQMTLLLFEPFSARERCRTPEQPTPLPCSLQQKFVSRNYMYIHLLLL